MDSHLPFILYPFAFPLLKNHPHAGKHKHQRQEPPEPYRMAQVGGDRCPDPATDPHHD